MASGPHDPRSQQRPPADADSAGPFDVSGETAEATIENLSNDISYELCVLAIDDVGNESVPSGVATGTPLDECDFMECYPGELETGYCGATLSPWWGGLVLAAIGWRRRRGSRP